MSNEPNLHETERHARRYISTGIPGLDTILKGGFLPGSVCLLQGDAGSGKTTVGLQYLCERVKQGERVLFIALTESRNDIDMICKSHGWSSNEISTFIPGEGCSGQIQEVQSSIFDPSDTEFGDLIKAIVTEIERVKPAHIVVDGISELRLLSGSAVRFRRQLLCIKSFLEQQNITTLLLDDNSIDMNSRIHHAIVNSNIVLEAHLPQYGRARRKLYIGKVRSAEFLEGFHDYEIRDTGFFVYPRLHALEPPTIRRQHIYSSGIPNLDAMFKGGLSSGTSAVFIGPSGVGKSSVAMQFVAHALKQKSEQVTKAVVFSFDEVLATFLDRSARLSFAGEHATLKSYLEDGRLSARQVDPAELTAGAFAQGVRDAVDAGASIVVIDSLNGYVSAMPEERFLTTHLHELVSYLNQRDVLTVMVIAQHGIVGDAIADFNVSYLADSILLFRYFESGGQTLQALNVFKKRTGPHEHTMRQLSITDSGIVVGEPLSRIKKWVKDLPHEDTAEAAAYLYQDEVPDIVGMGKDAHT